MQGNGREVVRYKPYNSTAHLTVETFQGDVKIKDISCYGLALYDLALNDHMIGSFAKIQVKGFMESMKGKVVSIEDMICRIVFTEDQAVLNRLNDHLISVYGEQKIAV